MSYSRPPRLRPHPFSLLLALAGLLACPARADSIVVFGEKDFYVLGPAAGAPPASPVDRARFFDASRRDMEAATALESAMDLVSPPEWGKAVGPSTQGRIQYHPRFPGGFECRLTLEHLAPDHDYILTLNGNPSRAGNDLLPSSVPGNAAEKYFDFLFIRTDAQGRYDARLGVFLKPGSYDVRCYVKDTADFKIVLYRDFFRFEVR